MLVLEWKKSAGADDDFQEFLRFDVDHLTKNAVSKVKRSEVHFPGENPWIWRVRCSLKEDDDGYRIKVRYAEEDQTGRVQRWFQRMFRNRRRDSDYYNGTTTIFVERNPEWGKAKKTGRFEWDPVAPNGEIEGQWRAIDGRTPRWNWWPWS